MVIAKLSLSHPEERTNLPLQLTSFVGRGSQIEAVKELLSRTRLVTLTGAGGIGKTRVALEVASQVMPEYEDGVWLVELAGLTDPELVPQAVLAALGFMGQPGRAPTESLINLLAARQLLCVLDNCEHLVEASAHVADALLKNCPELRILATSRDVLGVGGEVTWRVPSMAIPDAQRPSTVDDLQRCETVQLFVERADAGRPGFRITESNASSVARICHGLDGIPLAIELAAARVRSMSITAIDEHIADQFRLLTGGSRGSMPRQRTLRATFDWSHDLLSEEERRIFRWLSVFVGGFSLEAAEAVCVVDATDTAAVPVLESLSSLVDKSLVMWHAGAGLSGRYRLLEPLRQYAYNRLEEAQEADAARRSHAEFFLALGDHAYGKLRGPGQVVWMPQVVEELDNFRACFGWALSHDPSCALQLGVALERFWRMNNHAEGREWLNKSMERYSMRDELRARALYELAVWDRERGDLDEARQFGYECLALAQKIGSKLYVGRALTALAAVEYTEHAEGWGARGLMLLQQAEAHIREANKPTELGLLLNDFGSFLFESGDPIGARPKVEEGLALARDRNDVWQIAGFLLILADIEYESGETADAEGHWKQVLDLARQLGDRSDAAYALASLARLAVDEQPERFVCLLGAATSLLKLAGIIDAEAAQMLQEGQRSSQALLGDLATKPALAIQEGQRTARARLGDKACDAIWREGAGMSLAEAIRFGLGETIEPELASPISRLSVGDPEAVGESAFVREGEFWSLSYGGAVVRLKDSKGLRDIARLLATPGREVAAIALTSGAHLDAGRTVSTIAEQGFSVEADAGEALDAEARTQYRSRLADLEEEVSEAEANNDPERASRAREEREFLLAELAAAVGLGGRPRRLLDPAERARKAVAGRVYEAITHIEKVHRALGRHLRRSVRTGSFCVYDPAESTAWRLSAEKPGERSSGRQ